MRPTGVAPGEPSVLLPLCCGPNELRNNLRGLLTRWNHLDLRARKVQQILLQEIGLSSDQSSLTLVRLGARTGLRNLELLVGNPLSARRPR
jgi:hypothetical protein